MTVGDLHERYVHRTRPFANTFSPFDQKSFANITARCTYSDCHHTDNPEAPVHDDTTDVNDPTTWHRLARSAIGPGDNHCNHTFGGHREAAAPRVKATHVEVDAGAWRFLKAWSARWHRPLADVVSQLVRSAVKGGVPVEDAIDPTTTTAGTQTSPGRRARAFARLPGVDDETWTEFRAEAAEAGVTVARAVGILAEFAAAEIRRQLGEPADPSHIHPT